MEKCPGKGSGLSGSKVQIRRIKERSLIGMHIVECWIMMTSIDLPALAVVARISEFSFGSGSATVA